MSMNILILIVFVAAMYFIMIRPQQKAQDASRDDQQRTTRCRSGYYRWFAR